MYNFSVKCINQLNACLRKLDDLPLWWIGFVLLGIVMLPHIALGEGSVFIVHDQLDESMMNYVLTARHPWESVIPEMCGGINASGLQPSAILFVPLYRMLAPFGAFLCSYAILFLAGYIGMYLCVRELTESSILAAALGGVFCLLPCYPVYGLSQMGIPLVFYACLCLFRGKKVKTALALTGFFGLTSHLVYTGYAVLGIWALALVGLWLKRNSSGIKYGSMGFLLLTGVYVATNYRLFAEIFLGQAGYVSHREEMVSSAVPFRESVWDVFQNGLYHAPTYHKYLILPIFVGLAIDSIFDRKFSDAARKLYHKALGGIVILVGIALFYGMYNSERVVAWKNSVSGFWHYFQMDRFYWLYPAGWYLEFAMVLGVWWMEIRRSEYADNLRGALCGIVLPCVLSAVILYPTADMVLKNSYFYMNVNQYNNGSQITGYISWESFYAEEVMAELEQAIGRDMSSYRVAHLGISPAPALMHGFYTVDGYSNNYPLEYKHEFRKVIAEELEKVPETAVYFDKWGNRCYLFNSVTGNYWMLGKGSSFAYEDLDFDWDALRNLGCEYLFAGAQIADADECGLEYMGYFETESSYWGIWLYRLSVI